MTRIEHREARRSAWRELWIALATLGAFFGACSAELPHVDLDATAPDDAEGTVDASVAPAPDAASSDPEDGGIDGVDGAPHDDGAVVDDDAGDTCAPVEEVCGNEQDDDCDEQVDEDCTECPMGRADCDGIAANACEVMLATDAEHCGGCGRACSELERCVARTCVPANGSLGFGWQHSCRVAPEGSVWCWGNNNFGQLGDDTTTTRLTPVRVLGIDDAIEVDGGESHTCARRRNGSVVCWGRNAEGALGDGTRTNRRVPVQVMGANNVVQIALGERSSCARHANGTVSCWGVNGLGQLGDGTSAARTSATRVVGLSDAMEIDVGGAHGCAIRRDQTVRCWGSNTTGQLGNGTTTASRMPVDVVGIDSATSLALAEQTSCALVMDGTIRCWGRGTQGQVGDGATANRSVPVEVRDASDIRALRGGRQYFLAVRSDEVVLGWGDNSVGQLGRGVPTRAFPSAGSVVGLTGVVQLESGGAHSCAETRGGDIFCFGDNAFGQIGDGTRTRYTLPTEVTF